MKSKMNACLCIIGLFVVMIFSNCASTRHYDFSLKNTVSIFLLNNGKDCYFCISVQYMGEYQIENFEFDSGYILIGDYEISLKRNQINIYVYLNEANAEFGISEGEFNLVHSEENGRVLISKMSEPLTIKQDSGGKWNDYNIFIEKYLKKDDVKKIVNEYEKGNVYSKLYIGYDITIDNNLQSGSGMLDDFELYNGPAVDNTLVFPNLDFFRAKYLQK